MNPDLFAYKLMSSMLSESDDSIAFSVKSYRNHASSKDLGEVNDVRVKFYLEKLGLAGADLSILGKIWLEALARESLTTKQLQDIGQKAISNLDSSSAFELSAWRQAIESRIKESSPSLFFVEHLPPNQQDELTLELSTVLQKWPERLLSHKEWCCAESPLPEIPPLPLDKVWVDLQITDPQEESHFDDSLLPQAIERRYQDNQWLNQSIDFVLESLSGVMVLVGAPGLGKTTLMKWIARRLVQNSEGRFLFPLFVPLRAYAFAKAKQTDLDILSFAVSFCGVTGKPQIEQWVSVISYLSGPQRNTVLLLLDGWDEVPEHDKETLVSEINQLRYGFRIVITSRPSAYPRALPFDQLYEISELSPESITALIRQWHDLMQKASQADVLIQHLKQHPDLYKLARNPFLLNLLCAINLGEGNHYKALPSTRSELYAQTLEYIYTHHNNNPKYVSNYDRHSCAKVSELALWLLADSPNQPQYIFGSQEVEQAIGETNLLDEVLKPSRLLSQWHMSKESLHFLHTTFQEYLAAAALSERADNKLTEVILEKMHSPAWQEVLQFIAGNASSKDDTFWQLIRQQFKEPDLCGLTDIRLSKLVSEVGVTDGGWSLVGYDLRDRLWGHIKQGVATDYFVDAFARLDAADFVKRAAGNEEKSSGALQASVTRALQKIPTQESSTALVNCLLPDDLKQASVASYAVNGVLTTVGVSTLRSALQESDRSLESRAILARALGNHKDYTSIPVLLETYQNFPYLSQEICRALGGIGGEKGADSLASILRGATTSERKQEAVNGLGRAFDLHARDVLMTELAIISPHDELVSDILEALCEIPIARHSELVSLYLGESFPEDVRVQAIYALMKATEDQVTECLAKTGRDDASDRIRLTALAALKDRARSFDFAWLVERVKDESKSVLERANALEALFGFCKCIKQGQTSSHLKYIDIYDDLSLLVQLALQSPSGDLSVTAATGAYLLGSDIGIVLLGVCEDERFSAHTHEAACDSLGKLRYKASRGLLMEWVARSDVLLDDEAEPITDTGQRLATAAAKAWVQIDLIEAVKHPSKVVRSAVIKFALDNGYLVFKDRLINPSGKVFNFNTIKEEEYKQAPPIDPARLLNPTQPASEQQENMRWICNYLIEETDLACKVSRYLSERPYPLFSKSMTGGGRFPSGIDSSIGNSFLKGKDLSPQAAMKMMKRLEEKFSFVFIK